MSIRTEMSLVGFIASAPELNQGKRRVLPPSRRTSDHPAVGQADGVATWTGFS